MDYLNDTKIENRNLYEILSLNPDIPEDWEIIKSDYRAVDIDKVLIDKNPFTNYGDFQFIWEMSYVKEPKRSGNGSIGNLNSYAVFLTPHLILNFSVMSIDDYRKLMQLHYSIREHIVECYDPIYNKKVTVKMYFATEQMAKLHTIARKRFNGAEWEDWIELVGVREYTVDLIGTNNDLDLVSVGYVYNPPIEIDTPIPNEYEEDVYFGEEIIVGQNSTFIDRPLQGYKLKDWNTKADGSGTTYYNGAIMTVNNETLLYAQWETTENYTLAFNYGIASPVMKVDPSTGETTPITNTTVTFGKPIGTLPTPEPPYEEDSNTKKRYYPYTNGTWHKLPTKDSPQVQDNEIYWIARNDIIYLLYDKKQYTVTYETNYYEYVIPPQWVAYDEIVFQPTLSRQGYSFQGWYLDKNFVKQFTGKMPPYSITLYAKWVKDK